jgi:hypothetical protein
VVGEGPARDLTIDQDEAYYLDHEGNLVMVDIYPDAF